MPPTRARIRNGVNMTPSSITARSMPIFLPMPTTAPGTFSGASWGTSCRKERPGSRDPMINPNRPVNVNGQASQSARSFPERTTSPNPISSNATGTSQMVEPARRTRFRCNLAVVIFFTGADSFILAPTSKVRGGLFSASCALSRVAAMGAIFFCSDSGGIQDISFFKSLP